MGINYYILQYIFTNKSKFIDIIDSIILKGIKARLQSRDRQVTLEFANKKDKNKQRKQQQK